jgi:hypothetical protein
MTSGTGTEITLADLAKKVDDQARFTRSVSIICTIAILGVMFYTLTEMFSNLPAAIVLHYMANLEKIVYEWNAIENTAGKKKGVMGNPDVPGNTVK